MFKKKYTCEKVNLCGGSVNIEGYYNIDLSKKADIVIDLERKLLPTGDNSVSVLVCISAINYFTRQRGQEIIKDIYRVMKPRGIVRFGVQDFRLICKKYIDGDRDFFFQKLPNGKDRFIGETMADKINSWFYGYASNNKPCKYFYDFETLALLFKKAGFSRIEQKKYKESSIPEIDQIDNRPDQMFFLEAIK